MNGLCKAGLAAVFLGTLFVGVAVGSVAQDGEYLMAMVSSPQSLVMGTGEGKLTDGSATFTLPDSFCRCMEPSTAKVFLSSSEDVGGLTASIDGNKVTVKAGKNSAAASFSWLVVASPRSVQNSHDHK